MKADLYLKNAKIFTEDGNFTGGIAIKDGKIERLVSGDESVDAETVRDLEGKVVLPGLVDGHVHFNEPGRSDWEGYYTGSSAAAAGGITTVCDMPLNSTPPTINKEQLIKKRAVASKQSVVDFANWGGLENNNLDKLPELHEEGVNGFKAFLSDSGVDFERIDDDLLFAGLTMSKELGFFIGVHAENQYVTTYLKDLMQRNGRFDRAAWYESRPPETELEAINRACYWAEKTGGNLHIVHITIPDGIERVAESKKRGGHVTSETCPHYLYFNQEDFEAIGPSAKCAPPIRSKETVEDLWRQVFDKKVDVIQSDHSPCPWQMKAKGMDNIWDAWGGVQGIQTMLSVILTEGFHKRGLSLSDIVRMMCSNPARLHGFYPRKGSLAPGSDADLVVLDIDREWTLDADQLFSKNKHSAFLGKTFKGKAIATYVRGQLVYEEGKILAEPGFGQLVRRDYAYRF